MGAKHIGKATPNFLCIMAQKNNFKVLNSEDFVLIDKKILLSKELTNEAKLLFAFILARKGQIYIDDIMENLGWDEPNTQGTLYELHVMNLID